MFSGIVEEAASVVAITRKDANIDLTIRCSFADELHIDQSVAHNGVCLTVVNLGPDNTYTVTAVRETLERSMVMNGRLDGHIVQGHVDTTAVCTEVENADGSTYFTFVYDTTPEMVAKGYMTVEKGSVTVNGVSLTVCDSTPRSFRVAIIPYTFEHTNFCTIQPGTRVNLEFDIIGKYLARLTELRNL